MDSPIPLLVNTRSRSGKILSSKTTTATKQTDKKHTVSLKFDFFKGNFIIRSSLLDFSENGSKYPRYFFYRREQPSACPKLFIYSSKSNVGREFLLANLILFFFFGKVNSGVQDSHLLKGKVINLVMNCAATWFGSPIVDLRSCLVFKLEGTETCKLVSHF